MTRWNRIGIGGIGACVLALAQNVAVEHHRPQWALYLVTFLVVGAILAAIS